MEHSTQVHRDAVSRDRASGYLGTSSGTASGPAMTR